MLSFAFLLKEKIPDAFKEMKEIKITLDNANNFIQCLSGLRIIMHLVKSGIVPNTEPTETTHFPPPVTVIIYRNINSILYLKILN